MPRLWRCSLQVCVRLRQQTPYSNWVFLPGYQIELAFLVNIAGVILGRFLAPVLAHNYIDVHQHEIDQNRDDHK
ncbi:MAG: hypothetical protein LAT81_03385 [Oceanicaulis sp.]|nr:hypothetical protein [Oceanicaulis sp.]